MCPRGNTEIYYNLNIINKTLSYFYELGKNTKGNHRSTKERAPITVSSFFGFFVCTYSGTVS